jgi:signal transduction histidine kinase
MRGRLRLGVLGLRGRIVGAVLVTTVATLAVAAVALLGPLEHRLKDSALALLTKEGKAATHDFNFDVSLVADLTPSARGDVNFIRGAKEREKLHATQDLVGTHVGALVTLLGNPDASTGQGHLLLPTTGVKPPYYPGATTSDPFTDVARAFRTRQVQQSFGSIEGTQYARVAIPMKIQECSTVPGVKSCALVPYVLALRRPVDEVTAAVASVRTAFITAALAGIALSLILGIPLSATLVRRLRRLRQAALELAQHGPPVEVPVVRARDEVGDLARTFALMQSQLQQQEEVRRSFVATASHELRTPLASLEGMLELLDDDLRSGTPDLEDARSLVERARAQSRRLSRLAADLLDLSRIDARVQLRSEPVELGELSRAVLAEFELGTAERRITSELDDDAGPVWALGDPGSVARILRILLDNAVRVSPDGADIRVVLENGSNARLSVCDQGPGVPEDERELIFDRFQRGSGTSAKVGFGLGLAIGRELAHRMGGDLLLDSGYGRGAKFTLTLPVAHAPEEEPLAIA